MIAVNASAYLRICVSAYVRMRVCAYVRICVSACLRICVSAYLRICASAHLRIGATRVRGGRVGWARRGQALRRTPLVIFNSAALYIDASYRGGSAAYGGPVELYCCQGICVSAHARVCVRLDPGPGRLGPGWAKPSSALCVALDPLWAQF